MWRGSDSSTNATTLSFRPISRGCRSHAVFKSEVSRCFSPGAGGTLFHRGFPGFSLRCPHTAFLFAILQTLHGDTHWACCHRSHHDHRAISEDEKGIAHIWPQPPSSFRIRVANVAHQTASSGDVRVR